MNEDRNIYLMGLGFLLFLLLLGFVLGFLTGSAWGASPEARECEEHPQKAWIGNECRWVENRLILKDAAFSPINEYFHFAVVRHQDRWYRWERVRKAPNIDCDPILVGEVLCDFMEAVSSRAVWRFVRCSEAEVIVPFKVAPLDRKARPFVGRELPAGAVGYYVVAPAYAPAECLGEEDCGFTDNDALWGLQGIVAR